ncbi:dephospho-CoA kinase [Proteiniphilum sp.]|uniref:dephospho-CoA kinase n=1 Tax=Proteiniphilum sp. TaxID=1926877 RepID=UPI002B21B291|nr:dephospho-CoA kinase [Proteiniphilum sp.]MEA4916702.1 dephospho-CoA kinase [Proteiniphilum sp.]
MIKIGITGGIGSGKSIVSEIFHLYGVPLYNADQEAKKLNDTSPFIRAQLTLQFGEDLYVGGRLDRKKLASIIFHDDQKLSIVNSIIHPQLALHFTEWCRKREHYPVVILDAALLIEAGFNQFVNEVIIVQAPKELRISRVMQRDGVSRSEVEARMNSQLPEEVKLRYANHVITNDNIHSLIRQVSELMIRVTES